MNKLDVLNKQINNLRGLQEQYYLDGKFEESQGFQQQINELNGEVLRVSLIQAIEKRGMRW